MKKFFGALLAAGVLLPTVAATVAGAGESGFEWGNNKACAVLSPSEVRCFPTEAAMEAATSSNGGSPSSGDSSGDSVSTMSTTAVVYCHGRSDLWVYFYEHSNYGGRVLKFRDANLWQNLGPWDFDNKMSSYKNFTLCPVIVADGVWGGGDRFTIAANSSSSFVGWTWNDRATSFYIQY